MVAGHTCVAGALGTVGMHSFQSMPREGRGCAGEALQRGHEDEQEYRKQEEAVRSTTKSWRADHARATEARRAGAAAAGAASKGKVPFKLVEGLTVANCRPWMPKSKGCALWFEAQSDRIRASYIQGIAKVTKSWKVNHDHPYLAVVEGIFWAWAQHAFCTGEACPYEF